jgi:hypothetical protein
VVPERAAAGAGSQPPLEPAPATFSPEELAARIVRERDEANALAKTLVDLTIDATAAATLLQATGAQIVFEGGVPHLKINDAAVAITAASLSEVGLSKALIRNQGSSGSGGHTPSGMPPAVSLRQGALQGGFEFYKRNRTAILAARAKGQF